MTNNLLDEQITIILGGEPSPIYFACKDYYECSKKYRHLTCTNCGYYIREGKLERYRKIIELRNEINKLKGK